MTHRSELAYRVYLVGLLLVVLISPALQVAVVALSDPELALVLHREAAAVIAAATVALACAAMVAGAARGPVVLSPFRVYAVAGGPERRRVSLRGPFLRRLCLLVGIGAVLGALPGGALVRLGEAGAGVLVEGALVGMGAAVLVGVAWLAGQALTRRTVSWAVAGGLVLTGVLALGAPAGSLGLGGWAPLAVGVVGLLAVVPSLLDRLRGPVLLEQAQRWQGATTAGGAGDLAAAVATYRVRPRRALPAKAVGTTARLPLLFLRRDLVGAARTPVRSLVAATGLSIALLVGASALAAPGAVTWVAMAGGSALAYLALGVWSDGVRHAVEAMAAPTLYGVSDHQLLGLHTLLPVVAVLTVGAAVGLAVLLLGGTPLMAALAVSGALFGVAVRVLDAAKGPMPLTVLTPIPTPMGDASAVRVLVWQTDGLLLASVVPTFIGLAVLSAGALLLLAYLPATAGVLLALRHRLATV